MLKGGPRGGGGHQAGPRSPDVGLDAHAAALEARVHCEVDGVGGLPAVVLVDQHGVLCDVVARGVPGDRHAVGANPTAPMPPGQPTPENQRPATYGVRQRPTQGS